MANTSESIKEVAAIKKSCNIDTPLAMVMAAKLQKTVPVTYIKDIIQKKSFTFKLFLLADLVFSSTCLIVF